MTDLLYRDDVAGAVVRAIGSARARGYRVECLPWAGPGWPVVGTARGGIAAGDDVDVLLDAIALASVPIPVTFAILGERVWCFAELDADGCVTVHGRFVAPWDAMPSVGLPFRPLRQFGGVS